MAGSQADWHGCRSLHQIGARAGLEKILQRWLCVSLNAFALLEVKSAQEPADAGLVKADALVQLVEWVQVAAEMAYAPPNYAPIQELHARAGDRPEKAGNQKEQEAPRPP